MKKIGIITYHFALNYGSAIQCFALQEYLCKKGYDVKIINFVSEIQNRNNTYSDGVKGKVRKMLFFKIRKEMALKINRFSQFRNNKLHESRHVANLADLQELINQEAFDFIISGSDQVFNPKIDDYNEAFILPFDISAKKIAYAASIGDVTDDQLMEMKKSLQDFERISLREEFDAVRFKKDTGIAPEVVCDPVFLLDRQSWITIANNITLNYDIKKGYLLCYFIHKAYISEALAIAQRIAREKNLKIVCINAGYSRYSLEKNFIVGCGPDDFIRLFYDADYICTDSFHGTSFSIIFNKDFTCVDTEKNKHDNRRKYLLDRLGLGTRFTLIESNNVDTSSIDYKATNALIDNYRVESEEFLKL
jgi:hypothetical protein